MSAHNIEKIHSSKEEFGPRYTRLIHCLPKCCHQFVFIKQAQIEFGYYLTFYFFIQPLKP